MASKSRGLTFECSLDPNIDKVSGRPGHSMILYSESDLRRLPDCEKVGVRSDGRGQEEHTETHP